MKDRKYITDFVPEVCKGIKNKLDQLEDEDAWLRKENARLREALRWVNMSLCAYLDHAPANLKELAYYPEKAVSNAFRLLEGNDEGA